MLQMDDDVMYRIAIVGLGPKGLYGLEILLTQLKENMIDGTVEIHLFNTTDYFGAGDVYRIDQPEYLIMNYANSNINAWPKDNQKSCVSYTSDFVTWLKSIDDTTAGINDFAPRALVGVYLMSCLDKMLEALPEKIKVVKHVGSVTDVEGYNESYRLTWLDDATKITLTNTFQNILFTTGHTSFKSNESDKSITDNKIDFIYPVSQKLKHIKSDTIIGIKGMGLTSIDVILALTEGKGGKFYSDVKGLMQYLASGNEPKNIVVYSRSGLPMVPRDGRDASVVPLHCFTDETVVELKESTPINFLKTLLPLIKREFYIAFYQTLFRAYNLELFIYDDFFRIENQVASFHLEYPKEEKFSWERITNPFFEEAVLTHEEVKKYYEFLIQESEKGEEASPFMAAVGTWRKISPIFNELYSHGGLDAASHKLFDTYYFGLFNRLSYGPPLNNMKKMLALINAGILDFNYAKSSVILEEESKELMQIQNATGTSARTLDYLVNATIPRANEKGFVNELFQNLKRNKFITEFKNENGESYQPGCLHINKEGNPINESGIVNKDFTFYGTPTEGITFDNDTLSRSRNDFASDWAEKTIEAIQENEGIQECYER